MAGYTPAGPSDSAEWQEQTVGTPATGAVRLLLLPDADNARRTESGQPKVYYYLPAAPFLATGAGGRPVFSLTLILQRPPLPVEQTIHPLIERGILSLDLSLGLSPEALAALTSDDTAQYQPLFARESVAELLDESGEALATFQSAGSEVRGALSASLDRDLALDVLGALDGDPSRLSVRIRITFRTAGGEKTLRMRGSWAAIWDTLDARFADPDGEMMLAELQAAFHEMVRSGVIEVTSGSYGGVEQGHSPDAGMFNAFRSMSLVILQRQTPQLESGDPANRYRLRARPSAVFSLDHEETVSGAGSDTVELVTPLNEILEGALDAWDRDAFIHLVSSSGTGNPTGLSEVPKRVRSAPSRSSRDVDGTEPAAFAASEGRLRAMSSVLASGSRAFRPHQLLASEAVSPVKTAIGPIRDYWIDNASIADEEDQARSLPIVADAAAPLWRDRLDAALHWYAPGFEIAMPAPTEDPAASPFLFVYETGGLTSSGRRALSGTVRLTLRTIAPPETAAAITARTDIRAQSVPTPNLSMSLDLPFVDDRDGQSRTQSFPMEVRLEGDTVVGTLVLINDWVRVCYDSLSALGSERPAARIRVAYTLECYVPADPDKISVVFGGKAAMLAVEYSDQVRRTVSEPYLDAVHMVYRLPEGEVRMSREAPAAPGSTVPGRAQPRRAGLSLMDRPGLAAVAIRPAAHTAVSSLGIRPALVESPLILETVKRIRYLEQTMLREVVQEARFPCGTLGTFYRENRPGGSVTVGCQDALQLGQVTFRQFEEVEELRHPLYSVHRSLQQPGQFLVVPAAYRITRYPASEGIKAYRPILYLYSVLDATNVERNRVVLSAALQPDIPLFERRSLHAKLAALAASPQVLYPTQVPCEIESTLAVDSGIGEQPQVTRMPDAFQVSFPTDLTGAVLLRTRLETSGLYGSATFTLPDGTSYTTSLALELGAIVGPWESGPVQSVRDGETVRLTNRTERDLDVVDLVLYSGGLPAQTIPVEKSLPSGETVSVPGVPAAGEAVATYTVRPGTEATLAEVRSFIEDIHTNVLFLDLINHDNHGLQSLSIQVRLEGAEGDYPVLWTGEVGNVEILLPLTVQLDRRLLQYQIARTMASGETVTAPWKDWDLASGHVISLTWESIQ